MAHRVYHWKHGWIPLDGVALSERDHKAAISQVSKLQRLSPRGIDVDETTEKVEGAPHVQIVTHTAAGLPHVSPPISVNEQRPDEFTAAQKRESAGYVESVFQRLPGLHRGLDQPVEAVVPNDSYWAATDAQSRRHKVTLQKSLWDRAQVRKQMEAWARDKGAIAGQGRTLKEFRRRTVLHEMGHVVQLRARDQARGRHGFNIMNPIDAFVNERVTPRQMGYTAAADPRQLDQPVPRWAADSLNKTSAYATSSDMEFYAEAFLDGMVNGENASESGKRAIALADQLFGKAAS